MRIAPADNSDFMELFSLDCFCLPEYWNLLGPRWKGCGLSSPAKQLQA